jgi:hypothetical protein
LWARNTSGLANAVNNSVKTKPGSSDPTSNIHHQPCTDGLIKLDDELKKSVKMMYAYYYYYYYYYYKIKRYRSAPPRNKRVLL